MGLYQNKKFLHHRKPSKKCKDNLQNGKKNIFANYISDEEGFTIQKYNVLLLLNRKKKKNPNNQINGQKSEYDVSPKMIYQQPG